MHWLRNTAQNNNDRPNGSAARDAKIPASVRFTNFTLDKEDEDEDEDDEEEENEVDCLAGSKRLKLSAT
jgi:hypothetical protein